MSEIFDKTAVHTDETVLFLPLHGAVEAWRAY